LELDGSISPRGGRPSRLQAELIPERILDAAAALFLSDGYGVTSIESIARRARVSKRTLYQRFDGKPALFGAVLQRLVGRLRPNDAERLFVGGPLDVMLTRIAEAVLAAALAPDAIALHRLMLAEAGRFPELALIADELGARNEAIARIGALLQHAVPSPGGAANEERARFAAEQFLHMVVALPQRRALGLGPRLTADELKSWARDTVALFLHGYCGTPSI
jgi:AcrR family transcriptional regulator